MDLAWLSLAALGLTIAVSCITRLNPGIVALVLAWLIGVYVAPLLGTEIGLKQVITGFPAELFVTLTGVTLLFSAAQANGTLERLALAAERRCRGRASLVPLMFFGLALVISTVGAGSVAGAALVAPLAMAAARRNATPPFLMTLMVAHGAVAGTMSPFASTGVVAAELMRRIGLTGFEWPVYFHNLWSNLAVALAVWIAAYLWARDRTSDGDSPESEAPAIADLAFQSHHVATTIAIVLLIVGVVGFNIQVGFGALACALLLAMLRFIDETAALKGVPWGVILMVCGVTVLVSLLDKTGGIEQFSSLLSNLSSATTATGVVALATGLVSINSSTSGVVLPAFLPTIPGLIERLGGGDPLAIASSMVIGSNLVDVSPISTVGALCIAAAPPNTDRRRLFNQVLVWGVAMSAVAAVICYLFL